MSALETPRLRLRPFEHADHAAHAAIYADLEVTRFLPGGPFLGDAAPARSARSLSHFASHWAQHGFGVWAVVDKTTGAVIGQCGLNVLPDGSDVELLYALARATWGRGLATEAGRAALDHGFESIGLPRIVAVTRPEHRASQRVMEHLGMEREGNRELFGMHVVCYAVTSGRWRRCRAAAPA
jgi:ribosomal-protein-alanine N-acetyltransferase